MAIDKNFVPSDGNLSFDTGSDIPSVKDLNLDKTTDTNQNPLPNVSEAAKKILTDIVGVNTSQPNIPSDSMLENSYLLSGASEQWTQEWLRNYLLQGGLNLVPFSPNSEATPEENLNALSAWIANAFSLYDFSAGQSDYRNFGALLQYVYTTLSRTNNSEIRSLSDAATLEMAEKISDQCFTFISAQFQSALAYQSWYLQQEYNTPLNQINRLAAAGLHSAFALGNLNSGNASQMAGVPSVQNPAPSNAGQAESQSKGNALGLIGDIASSVMSFIPALGSAMGTAFKHVTEAQIAKKLLPLQSAKMGADIATNVQQVYNMRNDVALANSNQALKTMDTLFAESKDILDTANSEVNVAESQYRTLMLEGKAKAKELTWETKVRDKTGKIRNYTLDNVEMRETFKNGGVTRSGEIVVGSEDWFNELETRVKAGASKGNSGSSNNISNISKNESEHFGGKDFGNSSSNSDFLSNSILNAFNVQMDLSGEAANTFTKGGSKSTSQTTEDETNYSLGKDKSKSSIGYSEDGSEFHVGKSVFKSTETEMLVTLKEFKDRIDNARSYFEESVNRYNALTKEQQTRLLYWQDMLRENIGRFSGAFCGYDFANKIKLMYQPKQIQGD